MHKFMRNIIFQILIILFLATLTGCFMRTKVQNLRVDRRVHIDTMQSETTDISSDSLKGEYLYKVFVKGYIEKSINDTNSKAIDYFYYIVGKLTIVYFTRKIFVDIVPILQTTNNSESIRSQVKYNYFKDKTGFEFYQEHKFVIPKVVDYKIVSTCGHKKHKIWLLRKE